VGALVAGASAGLAQAFRTKTDIPIKLMVRKFLNIITLLSIHWIQYCACNKETG